MPNAIEISAVDSFCAIRAIDGAKQIKTLAFGGEASTNRGVCGGVCSLYYSPAYTTHY